MKNYSWQRYWYKSGDSPHITNGFLYVSEYLENVFTLDSQLNIPCLILLGEPGMGKSHEIGRIKDLEVSDENQKDYINLSSYSDESRLIGKIFSSDKIKKWKDSNTNFYLYLDSLDEALLNINTLASLLADEISDLPTERLFFRIACRTVEWSSLSLLENKLRDLWKDDKFQILQIAPLQSQDAYSAAKDSEINADKFFQEVSDRNIQPLAAKPVTLKLLLNLYKKENKFPSIQSELYEKGGLALCNETSESRIASKKSGNLSEEQRLSIAGRIASVMIFTNKSSIWTAIDIGEKSDSDVSVNELTGYFEIQKDGSKFKITESEIRETLDTGLFTGAGNSRIKFSHQTFAEYLAAWYLDYRQISDETILKIIGEKYLYPQLYETSAWIASRRVSIFRHLMKIAPVVLLRSDVISADEDLRAELVERLLEVFENEEARDDWFHGYYRKLKHPKLAEQIRPYITDKNKGWLVRKVAIDIADSCELVELQNDLADVALDKSEDRYTRINAAYAVTRIGEGETRSRLKPLIYEENDEHSELKGRGLAATWREYLTVEELFDVLTMPPHSYFGSYTSFINYELTKKLKVEDLPIALKWISEKLSTWGGFGYELEKLVDEILIMAWQNLDRENIFESFVAVVIKMIKGHGRNIFSRTVRTALSTEDYIDKIDEIKKDHLHRRKIWLKIFSLIDEDMMWSLNASEFVGIGNNDIEWLIQEWNNSEDVELKAKLLLQIKSFVSYWETPPEILSQICKACDENELLRREFEEIFAPIELNSEKAKQLKEHFNETFKWRRERELKQKERETLVNPSPLERTLEFINRFEDGEIEAFWQINFYMMFLPTGYSEGNELESNMTKFPVWKELSDANKSRIINAAKNYLLKGDPQTEQWIGTNTIYRPAFAGYKAIILLQKYEPEFIEFLDKTVWAKWAPIIYYYPIYNGSGTSEYENHRKLIAKTYEIAPEEIIKLFKQEIESKPEETHWAFGKLEYCWDEKLKDILKKKLNTANLKVSEFREFLSQLFELKDPEAEKYACKLIVFPIPEDSELQELLMISAELLTTYGKMSCWQKIWEILDRDIEFGKKLIEFGVFRFGRLEIDSLSEKELADLYIWLSKQYPHSEDPVHHGVYSPGARDEIVRWRNSILDTLVDWGSEEAVNQISRIKDTFPKLEWLKFTVLRAREKMYEITFSPLLPHELIDLLVNGNLNLEERMSQTLYKTDILSKDLLWNKPIEEIPNLIELLDEYKNDPDDFAFFVGAGLSLPIFPLWDKLLQKMIHCCSSKDLIRPDEKDELFGKVEQKRDFLDIAEYCKKKLGDSNYRKFLEETFDINFPQEKISPSYKQLFKLHPQIIITTNFDQIPERLSSLNSLAIDSQLNESDFYRVYDNTRISEARNAFKKHPVVFKMHGCISNHDSIVFTSSEFDKIINNQTMRNFMSTILGAKRVLFLGFSFSDPHMDFILKFIREIYGGLSNPHYALMSNLSRVEKEILQNKYDLNVISYQSTDNHPEVLEFLQLLEKTKN